MGCSSRIFIGFVECGDVQIRKKVEGIYPPCAMAYFERDVLATVLVFGGAFLLRRFRTFVLVNRFTFLFGDFVTLLSVLGVTYFFGLIVTLFLGDLFDHLIMKVKLI